MVNTIDLVNRVMYTLNEYQSGLNIELFANAKDLGKGGTLLKKSQVFGIATPIPGSITPLQGINNYNMALSFTLVCKPCDVDKLHKLILTFIEDNIGTTIALDEYAALVSYDMPLVGDVSQRPGIGESITLSFQALYRLVKGGVISNDCKLEINGNALLALNFGFARVRVLDTAAIDNAEEMRSLAIQQGFTVEVSVPYQKTDIVKEIVADITCGVLAKHYTLRYSDPCADFEKSVILESGTISYEAGKIPVLAMKFVLN